MIPSFYQPNSRGVRFATVLIPDDIYYIWMNYSIAFNFHCPFDRRAEITTKFWSDRTILNTNLAASNRVVILRLDSCLIRQFWTYLSYLKQSITRDTFAPRRGVGKYRNAGYQRYQDTWAALLYKYMTDLKLASRLHLVCVNSLTECVTAYKRFPQWQWWHGYNQKPMNKCDATNELVAVGLLIAC